MHGERVPRHTGGGNHPCRGGVLGGLVGPVLDTAFIPPREREEVVRHAVWDSMVAVDIDHRPATEDISVRTGLDAVGPSGWPGWTRSRPSMNRSLPARCSSTRESTTTSCVSPPRATRAPGPPAAGHQYGHPGTRQPPCGPRHCAVGRDARPAGQAVHPGAPGRSGAVGGADSRRPRHLRTAPLRGAVPVGNHPRRLDPYPPPGRMQAGAGRGERTAADHRGDRTQVGLCGRDPLQQGVQTRLRNLTPGLARTEPPDNLSAL